MQPSRSEVYVTEYVLGGMTPGSFFKPHGGVVFDLEELSRKFATHCTDYLEPLDIYKDSKALQFCIKVIFEIGQQSDKIWRFEIKVPETADSTVATSSGQQQKMVKHEVTVSNRKGSGKCFESGPTRMIMTVKEANLVAMKTLNNYVSLMAKMGKYILTPRANAIFSKLDLHKIATISKISIEDTIIKINSSCQWDGHYLPFSDGTFAALYVYTLTSRMTDRKKRATICDKVVTQYWDMEKPVDVTPFRALAQFTTGDFPVDVSLYVTEELNEIIKMSSVEAIQFVEQTATKTRADKEPTTLPDSDLQQETPVDENIDKQDDSINSESSESDKPIDISPANKIGYLNSGITKVENATCVIELGNFKLFTNDAHRLCMEKFIESMESLAIESISCKHLTDYDECSGFILLVSLTRRTVFCTECKKYITCSGEELAKIVNGLPLADV